MPQDPDAGQVNTPIEFYDENTAVDERSPSTYGKNSQYRRVSSTMLVSYECRNPESGELVFQKRFIHHKPSLKIFSSSLIHTLREALIDFPHLSQKDALLSPATSINEPYELIFYNRKKLSELAGEAKGSLISPDIKLLLEFLEKENPHVCEKLDEIEQEKCNVISFEDLWIIYPPGATVFRNDDGAWRAYKVERVEFDAHLDAMHIYCYFLDFDESGQWLVPQLEVLQVQSYSSSRSIESLEVVPDWFFRRHDGFHKKLKDRGTEYWSFKGRPVYCEYTGDAWPRTLDNDASKVVVDYVTSSKREQEQPHTSSGVSSCSICLGQAINLHSYPNGVPHDFEMCPRRNSELQRQPDNTSSKPQDSLLFCPSRVWAFSMKHKSWNMVPLQDLRKVQENGGEDDAFQKLRMKAKHKKCLESMLVAHLKNKPRRNSLDFIKGKGQGLNILLHGGPGTGKTLTAECLAKKHRVPLYVVTSGDLGTDVDTIKKRLRIAVVRATNWGAILLLDDVDVFFQPRSSSDPKRNAIISIFLHVLDYSEALLFITTNCIENLDPAVDSRIHMAFELPQLDFETQKAIWINFIGRLELDNAERPELESFVNVDLENLDHGNYTNMNGRQIRNGISAALALAGKEEDCSLRTRHIKETLMLGKEFKAFTSQPHIQVSRDRSAYLTQQLFKKP